MNGFLQIILQIVLFFAIVAIPLVIIISAISIFTVCIIAHPIIAIAVLVVLIVRKNQKKKKETEQNAFDRSVEDAIEKAVKAAAAQKNND